MNLSVLTLGGGQCSDVWRLWQGQSTRQLVSTCSFMCAEFQWGEILQSFWKLQWSPCFLFGIGQIAYRERNGWGGRGRCWPTASGCLQPLSGAGATAIFTGWHKPDVFGSWLFPKFVGYWFWRCNFFFVFFRIDLFGYHSKRFRT